MLTTVTNKILIFVMYVGHVVLLICAHINMVTFDSYVTAATDAEISNIPSSFL